MGPRVNPATNDMLRVPGVVGMDYQSAMAALQQAGLNPRVNRIKKKTTQYAGEEGTVVKQVPSAGGTAMLGSSVSITVYLPGNRPVGQGYPSGAGAPAPSPGDGGYGAPGDDQGGYPQDGGPIDDGGATSGQSGNGDWVGPSPSHGTPPSVAPTASVAPGSGVAQPSAPPPQWQLPATGSQPGGSQSGGANGVASPPVPVKPEGEKYLHSPQDGGLLR